MLSFIKNLSMAFHKYDLEQLSGDLENPGRGWYRIYTFHIGAEQVEEPVRYPGESLSLVLLDIGAYRDKELDQDALHEMRRIMKSFVSLGFDLILRICYDTEGKGMVREPSLFSLVKRHISQIAPVVKEFASSIYVYQGLLVGNWGEMHESKFLSAKCLKELMEIFLGETEGKVRLAIRKPVQLRIAYSEESICDGKLYDKVGFFNDGILGSKTHLGTFAPETSVKSSYEEMWAPADEIAFMKPFLDHVPYGGEALKGPEPESTSETERILRELRVSYLNSTHDEKLLEEWKSISYGEGSLYEQVGRRLGYRFCIRDVSVKKGKRWECRVQMENVGYGALYDDAEGLLWLERSQGHKELLGSFEGDLRGMQCGENRELHASFEMPELEKGMNEKLRISISLRRKKDQKPIYFAQKALEDRVILGEIGRGK